MVGVHKYVRQAPPLSLIIISFSQFSVSVNWIYLDTSVKSILLFMQGQEYCKIRECIQRYGAVCIYTCTGVHPVHIHASFEKGGPEWLFCLYLLHSHKHLAGVTRLWEYHEENSG